VKLVPAKAAKDAIFGTKKDQLQFSKAP